MQIFWTEWLFQDIQYFLWNFSLLATQWEGGIGADPGAGARGISQQIDEEDWEAWDWDPEQTEWPWNLAEGKGLQSMKSI